MLTVAEQQKHLDVMEVMIDRADRSVWNPVSRYILELPAENINMENMELMRKDIADKGQMAEDKFKSENTDKEYDLQWGDSVTESGSMLYWFILCEKL